MKFENVSAYAKANIYFDGKVVLHKIVTADGETKTFGVIFPGEYHVGTESAERMNITTGSCKVQFDGEDRTAGYAAGEFFVIEANSGFTITVGDGGCQYVCSYLG